MTMMNAYGFYRVKSKAEYFGKNKTLLNRPEIAYYAPITDCVEVNMKVHQELQPPINWHPEHQVKMAVRLKERLNKDT